MKESARESCGVSTVGCTIPEWFHHLLSDQSKAELCTLFFLPLALPQSVAPRFATVQSSLCCLPLPKAATSAKKLSSHEVSTDFLSNSETDACLHPLTMTVFRPTQTPMYSGCSAQVTNEYK